MKNLKNHQNKSVSQNIKKVWKILADLQDQIITPNEKLYCYSKLAFIILLMDKEKRWPIHTLDQKTSNRSEILKIILNIST